MSVRWTLLAVMLVAASGCSDDPSPEEERADLIEDLAENLVLETGGAIDAEQARCVATGLIDQIGPEVFETTILAAATDDRDRALQLQVIDSFSACNALGAVLEAAQSEEPTTPSG